MGYAKNIGRLGALAVALGVGYGVADMPVAFADDTASDSGSSAPARAGRGHAASSASDNGPARGSGHRGAPSAPNSLSAPEPDSALADIPSLPVITIKSEPVRNDAPPAPAAALAAPAASVNSAPAPAPAVSSAPAVRVAPAAAQPAPAATAPDPAATTVAVAPAATTVVSKPVTVPATAAPAPKPAAALASLVASVLSPLLNSGTGGAPGQAPVLFGVLAWVRKEFERITGITLPAATTTTSQVQSPNLLVNPGAELSTPSLSGFSAVSMPGWTVTGTPTVIKYGTPRVIMPLGLAFPLPNYPQWMSFVQAKNGATNGGNQYFGGGNVADSTISQTVDLSAAAGSIDGGNISYNLGAWLGGYGSDPSAASVKVTFLDSNKTYLGSGNIAPVTQWDRWFGTKLLDRNATGTLPTGTRYAQVDVILDDKNPMKIGPAADYNNAFVDNISFTIGAQLPAPPAPTPVKSIVGPLKHVYMVYMENKGYTNIVGSPNAPFLNSLINAYGFANNYYALTHGSLPNYYPIIGGDNFGITYNCAKACIDVPKADTLVGQIEAAGLTWKSYAQGLAPGADPTQSSGDYAFDETGFTAYNFIGNDPAYAKQHIVPLEQMAIDLQSKATAPNYVWWAADEDNNGEGPVDGITGALKFALNQLDPQHQYNVKALDAFLAQTVPTIMNSNAWKSDEASAIVVTFDEDNNNTSLGFGNEGNHIVTVVIPNQAAVDGGMRAGHFLATDHYNHYSLLRMIEESLGLPGQLTQNDKFANPMNEFWTGVGTAASGSVV
jgi:hypothetical protein